MCRNIRVLHGFEPPSTRDEMQAAALQYVRKVSGLHHGTKEDEVAFDRAVKQVAAATERLLATLKHLENPRTREAEREKAKVKWQKREQQLAARFKANAR